MFGYKLIKEDEIENLKRQLADANEDVVAQAKKIAELNNKIKEYEKTIANSTKHENVKSEKKVESKEEKPVKKVRRKYTKKNTKKED
jgi:uncharacterized coiled-coil protein SlyX